MDVKALREAALAETERSFRDKGIVPDPDSDEYEDEFRRHFERLKKRQATAPLAPAAAKAAPEAPLVEEGPGTLPVLQGTASDVHWANAVRASRLALIKNRDARAFLATTWQRAREWLHTRDVVDVRFLQIVDTMYAEHRKQSQAQAGVHDAEQKLKTDALAAVQRQLKAAGITVDGLIELVDASNRVAAAPLKQKLVELSARGRALRIFETANAGVLLVLEKNDRNRLEYAIERDEGLVADLALYAQSVI